MSYSSGIFVPGQSVGTSIIDRNGNIIGTTLTVSGATSLNSFSSLIGTCTQRLIVGAATTYTFPSDVAAFQGLAIDTKNTTYNFPNVSNLSNLSMTVLGNGTATGLSNITVTNFAALYIPVPAFSGFTVTNTWGLQSAGRVYINNSTASNSTTSGALVVDGGIGVGGNLYVSGSINGSIVGSVLTAGVGSAAAPSFTFSGATNSGIYYDTGSSLLGFSNSGTSQMTISSTGTVTVPNGQLLITNLGAAASPAVAIGAAANDGIYSSGAGVLNFATGGTNRVTLSSAALNTTVPIITVAGSATSVPIRLVSSNDGFYRIAAGNPAVAASGTNIMNWTATRVSIPVAGSAAVPSLGFSTDTGSGIYRPAADQIGISAAGTQILGVSATGLSISSGTLTIPITSNQIVLGTTNTVTINAATSAASRTYTISDVGTNTSFIMASSTGGQNLAGGITFSGSATFGSSIAATGSGSIDFSGSSGIFKVSGGASTIGPGTVTISGQSTFSAAGSSTPASATIYVNPASTALSGINNFYFTYLNTPTTSGTTTGIAATFAIAGAPPNSSNPALAFYVIGGKSSFADTTASTSTTTGSVTISGGLGVAGAIYAGSSISGISANLSNTTNQLVLGTTNTVTINSAAPAASRVYTIPDVGTTASFLMTASSGGQTVTGGLTISTGVLSVGGGLTVTSGNVSMSGSGGTFSTPTGNVTIGSGAISVTGATTFSNSISASGSGNVDFSGSSGTFLTSAGSVTVGPGAVTISGRSNFTSAGSSTAANSTVYVKPGTTTFSGSNNYFFTYLDAPTTISGSTTGTAATVTIGSAPASATTSYAFQILSGKTYLADSTASASSSTGALIVAGGVGIGGNLYVGGTIFGTINGTINTNAVTLTGTSNQIILGTGNTITLNAPAPAASRVYTIPDVGGAASFIMSSSTGGQTITGPLTVTTTGSGNTDFSGSTGTFKTSTGSNTYNGLKYNAVPAALTSGPVTLTTAAGGTSLIILNGGADFTVTLPSTSGNNGLEYSFINTGAGVVTIQVSNTGTENFDGNSSNTSLLLGQNERMRVICYSSKWYTF